MKKPKQSVKPAKFYPKEDGELLAITNATSGNWH
jgi:hypothetical protein